MICHVNMDSWGKECKDNTVQGGIREDSSHKPPTRRASKAFKFARAGSKLNKFVCKA